MSNGLRAVSEVLHSQRESTRRDVALPRAALAGRRTTSATVGRESQLGSVEFEVDKMTIRIELSADARAALLQPITGHGGFQSLLRQVQRQVDDSGTLVLNTDLVRRIASYATNYGRGGFQERLGTVLDQLVALARALAPLAA